MNDFAKWLICNGLALDAEGDEWITVHPNENGTGRHVLLDGEGYIKAGMGGKFKGQRIDLIPRKRSTPPSSGAKIKEVKTSGGNKSPFSESSNSKVEKIKGIFKGISNPDKNQEVATAFKDAPDDLVGAMSKHLGGVGYIIGTGDKSNAGEYLPGEHAILIGENEREQRDKVAKGEYSDPKFESMNNGEGTIRHECGHALDDNLGKNFIISKLSTEEYNSNFSKWLRDEIKKMPPLHTTESGIDSSWASSASKDFVKGYKDSKKNVWTSLGVGKGKVINAEIANSFGLKYDGFGRYIPDPEKTGATLSKCAPLSDILSALTGGKAGGHWTHTDSYWKDAGEDGRRQEIFANLTSMYSAKDRTSWNEAERLFPELTTAYKKMIARA